MLEYVTEAEAADFSTSAGTPEVDAQVPRATPGVEGAFVVGYAESSQSMSAE